MTYDWPYTYTAHPKAMRMLPYGCRVGLDADVEGVIELTVPSEWTWHNSIYSASVMKLDLDPAARQTVNEYISTEKNDDMKLVRVKK